MSNNELKNNYANPEIDSIIEFLGQQIKIIFPTNLVGIYLFGSLSYGDFVDERSDVDILVVVKNKVGNDELEKIHKLYENLGSNYPKWKGRIECSFTLEYLFKNKKPPREARPYFGERFYKDAIYGNEWLINNYLIQQYGVTINGPDFKKISTPVSIQEVQEACRQDLLKEWEPKLHDLIYLDSSHNQSYFVLNLCRILYTIKQADARSKKVAADWVRKKYPQWKSLVDEAQSWLYGKTMKRKKDALDFLRFILNETENND